MSLWQWMCVINGYNEAHAVDDGDDELSEEEKSELFELVTKG